MRITDYINKIARASHAASRLVSQLTSAQKNAFLSDLAGRIAARQSFIMRENQKDVLRARKQRLSSALIDRLILDEKRIRSMRDGLMQIAELEDPVGKVIYETIRPNGLRIQNVRAAIGVIAVIYESRPNVTVDAAALCLKASSSVILRGGSEALHSNRALIRVIGESLSHARIPSSGIQLVNTTDRRAVAALATCDRWVDVIIPRGGEAMIHSIRKKATVPVIAHGKGLCHTYVDEYADIEMALDICYNAKVQRPGVCNAMETLLVHENIAQDFLPLIIERYRSSGVEVRGDASVRRIMPDVKPAQESDWQTEYLALIVSVKVVSSLEQALGHIERYGSRHSEAIVTRCESSANTFLSCVNAAAVYWNASTRFTDGQEFGMGAEIGISTQMLHCRGPMGLNELTTNKYIVRGTGQVRT